MSKPKMYGMKTAYVPNAEADMRHHKTVYQRQRERRYPGTMMSGSWPRGRLKRRNAMGIKCCYGCVAPKRFPGCGATCPEYIKEKAEDTAKKEAYNKEVRLTGEIRGQRKLRYARYLQHRGRKK